MKSLHEALLEYKSTPKEFNPYLCFSEDQGKYIVITFSKPVNIEKLMKLKVIL